MTFFDCFGFSANYLTLAPLFHAEVLQTMQETSQLISTNILLKSQNLKHHLLGNNVRSDILKCWNLENRNKMKLWSFETLKR